jgi:hypothetical protein
VSVEESLSGHDYKSARREERVHTKPKIREEMEKSKLDI